METQIILNYTKFACSIYFEGNQYLHRKLIFKLIKKILNDEDNLAKLRNEFHNETPLIVIENCFLPVLANNLKIVFVFLT